MAIDFSMNWNDEIAEVSTQVDYQTCEIKILDPDEIWYPGPNYPTDPSDLTKDPEAAYDWETNEYIPAVMDGVVYEGQARFIPIRSGIYYGGESQANATTTRAVRFQLPQFDGPLYIRMGLTVKFTSAPRNPSLVGRWATVNDDFQGASAAARTFTATMDIDGGQGG